MTLLRYPRGFVLAVLILPGVLSACTSADPVVPGEPQPSAASAAPTAAPLPELFALPEGSAADNQVFFDQVNRQLIDSGVSLNGAAFVENLLSQGYPRERMEVTPDTTAIGVAADNIVFSIRFGEQCLLGQWGNIGYTSMIAETLSTGRCLIGTERDA